MITPWRGRAGRGRAGRPRHLTMRGTMTGQVARFDLIALVCVGSADACSSEHLWKGIEPDE